VSNRSVFFCISSRESDITPPPSVQGEKYLGL
jgi:hypothetical protein